ncbi:MAG: 2-C-methyl-D-erythritol 4-phosphate cytidylyltransferase [bacterium]|nr:2-C-methyl-D-erythritol 4-phosphate cytidylyltransferase [bacterium]
MSEFSAIVVAAGQGKRFGGDKAFVEVFGKYLVEYSLEVFERHPLISEVVLVLSRQNIAKGEELKAKFHKLTSIVEGGAERSESVRNGVREAKGEYVLIHDSARANVSKEIVNNVIAGLKEFDAVVPGIPVRDTVGYFESEIFSTQLERDNLYLIQTPQGFRRKLLLKCYEKAQKTYTDESTMVFDLLGIRAKVVEGSFENFKITYPEDLVHFKKLLGGEMGLRVGLGYDSHRLEQGKTLILGGVVVSKEIGPVAHSDGDCLVHSIIDAFLGAVGDRDIGYHFPDSDPKFAGVSSLKLLGEILEKWKSRVEIINVDSFVKLEKPKIRDLIPEMKGKISRILEIAPERINIKAKTGEMVGPVGESRLIECETIILLRFKS